MGEANPVRDALGAFQMVRFPAAPVTHHDSLRRGEFTPRSFQGATLCLMDRRVSEADPRR